jgi:hypothetical protein
LERKIERQQLGLETLPSDCALTFGQLVQWRLDTYSKPMPSQSRNESYSRRHLLNSVLAALPVPRVTASDVETFLQSKVHRLVRLEEARLALWDLALPDVVHRIWAVELSGPLRKVEDRPCVDAASTKVVRTW